jgi:hypothetical protein
VTILGFSITFYSPFRVGSTYARDGVDAALDQHDPLPPDHLKGLMRAAATDVLGLSVGEVGEVFGSPRNPSPWAWSSAQAVEDWEFSHRHRVSIDATSHSALKDHLVLGEQAWARRARFEISCVGQLQQEAARRHILVLRCAASAVHGLGSWRRRGLGWVGIVPEAGRVSDNEVTALLSSAGTGEAGGRDE